MEAQEIEKQVLSMSQWMTEISKEIQNRLDADVLAGDVPEEHEVSYRETSSQWMTEISKEIQNRLDADVLAGDVPEEHK